MNKWTLVFPLALIAFLLLVFFEYFPLLRKPLDAPTEDKRRWNRRDSLLCLCITLIYAVTAFFGLGNREGIESVCKLEGSGDFVLIELNEPTYIGSIRYYPSLHTGLSYVEFSEDGSFFEAAAEMPQRYADLFKWRTAELTHPCDRPVRYLRISSTEQLWLGELVIFDADGRQLGLADLQVSSAHGALFDEQDKVPASSSFRDSTYFDEIYHARTALEHIENVKPYEISHPPLGKLILGLGIRLFGMVPFGWRFMGTLFGALMLPGMYVFLKKMFGGSLVPAGGTIIFASDFMHFVQTRIATIDTYVVFFILLMYLFFWLYWQSDRSVLRSWLPPLALSGVCFGLGAASKWTGLYAGAGLGVLWLLDRIFRARAAYAAPQKQREQAVTLYWRETRDNVLWCLLLFVLVPACIYYLSYWYYGTAAGLGGMKMLFSKEYFNIVLENQKYMFNYHSGVNATHPYSSVWWQWLLDVRPILYYLDYLPDGRHVSFGAWVNPLLCWGGLGAMLCMVYQALLRKDKAALFIVIAWLTQLLPWMFVKRIVFEYHYFPSTLFLLLALGHVFHTLAAAHPRGKRLILSTSAVSVVLFAVFYPALAGLPVSSAYGTYFLKWLSSWPF